MNKLLLWIAFVMFAGTMVVAQETGEKAVVSKGMSLKFAPVPGFPDCATLAALKGDPGKGASVVELKFEPACVVPWHWHSTNESAIPLSGLLEVSMKGEKPVIISNGDFGFLPAKHVHQAKCTGTKPCVAIFVLEGAFDIHYVDKDGGEIPAEKALASVNKATGKAAGKP